MEKKDSKYVYIAMCIIFVIAIIVIGISFSYAIGYPKAKGETTESKIKTNTYDKLETSLSSTSAIEALNISPIDYSQVNHLAPSLSFTAKTNAEDSDLERFNIYLKDITISNNFITNAFKWELLMDDEIIANGTFENIETVGTASTSKTNTENIKYYDTYYLKNAGTFNSSNQSDFIVRVYLLNNNSNQNALMNGTFEAKVAIEEYTVR